MERRETIEIEETEKNRETRKNKDNAVPLSNFLLNLSFLSFIISLGLFIFQPITGFFLLNLSFLSFNPFFSYLFNFSA